MTSRMEMSRHLKPLGPYGHFERSGAIEHLEDSKGLYQAGEPRWICCLLGVLHQELQFTRPGLAELVLEATWMAMKMDDSIRRRKTAETQNAK